MLWLLAAPIISKVVERIVYVIASLIVAFLLAMPMLGILLQPLSPWWLSGQHTSTVVGGAAPAPVDIAVSVPTLSVVVPTSVVERVISAATSWLGTPYLWGGCTRRGIDCSCFVQSAWAAVGVRLPRTTTDQVRAVAFVPRDQIQRGDLVFFNNTCTECGANPTHVGLALGGGQMIDAGDPVQINSITSGFYSAHYASAGRVSP